MLMPLNFMAGGIMFSGHSILVNAISQERLEGISSVLTQMFIELKDELGLEICVLLRLISHIFYRLLQTDQ